MLGILVVLGVPSQPVRRREREQRQQIFFAVSRRADDIDLPDTGIGYEREKLLSAIFIETPVYGTRSSSLVLIDKNFQITLDEINYQ